ncbi:MAG: hypothetical protein UHD09_07920, partial [Bifidobacterium sp.]|nr:hypothetical protein [Bifidobacterium sp.]
MQPQPTTLDRPSPAILTDDRPPVRTATRADPAWLADPRAYAVNRLPAHTDHACSDGGDEQLVQSLDGTWRVRVEP